MSDKQVAIIMGSDSDLQIMKDSALALEEFNIGYDISVSSAHRHPDKTANLARRAAEEGKKVIIAGAGGAAHLPGVLASMTSLPVIGVPILTSGMGGVDSLYSIVQMPRGIPVATVAVNGAFNAGLLAVQIISTTDEELFKKYQNYRQGLASGVEEKDKALQEKGWQIYLDDKFPPGGEKK